MNTRKQVLLMSALLLMSLVLVGIYAAWYPSRASGSEKRFEQATTERGAIIFARNCRLGHGDAAEGGAWDARLAAAPALDRPDLQGFADTKASLAAGVTASATSLRVTSGTAFKANQTILVGDERMVVQSVDGTTVAVQRGVGHAPPASHASGTAISALDASVLKDKVKLITNTITCGRVGTAMPAWAQSQGGPLSDEQVRQLMTLITTGGWSLVKEEDDKEDVIPAKLLVPLSGEATSVRVNDVTAFTEKDAIRIGDERLRVTSVPKIAKDAKDKSGVIGVQRGILNTTPLDHEPTEKIFKFPETSEPAINASSCGQTARPAAPAGNPELIEPFEGQTVEVTAANIAFDKKDISVKTGGKVRLRLNNADKDTDHNIAVYKSATDLNPASPGSVGLTFKGPAVDDTAFDTPAVGSYIFRCDVHPTIMFGNFTVTN